MHPLPPPQPYLFYVLCALTACVGVANHYLLPQLRKDTPWIWIAHPIIKPKEYGIYEASGTANCSHVWGRGGAEETSVWAVVCQSG